MNWFQRCTCGARNRRGDFGFGPIVCMFAPCRLLETGGAEIRILSHNPSVLGSGLLQGRPHIEGLPGATLPTTLTHFVRVNPRDELPFNIDFGVKWAPTSSFESGYTPDSSSGPAFHTDFRGGRRKSWGPRPRSFGQRYFSVQCTAEVLQAAQPGKPSITETARMRGS